MSIFHPIQKLNRILTILLLSVNINITYLSFVSSSITYYYINKYYYIINKERVHYSILGSLE